MPDLLAYTYQILKRKFVSLRFQFAELVAP